MAWRTARDFFTSTYNRSIHYTPAYSGANEAGRNCVYNAANF